MKNPEVLVLPGLIPPAEVIVNLSIDTQRTRNEHGVEMDAKCYLECNRKLECRVSHYKNISCEVFRYWI